MMFAMRVLVCVQLTPEMLACVEQRLEHLTFVVPARKYDQCIITVAPYDGPNASTQPEALRELLRLLSLFRWRLECESAVLKICIEDWALTPALIHELSALPCVDGPASLTLQGKDCVSFSKCDLSSLVSTVPACYSRYIVEQGQVEGACFVRLLTQLCVGAARLSPGGKRLALSVSYATKLLSDAQRSQVEACMDEHDLQRWWEPITWF